MASITQKPNGRWAVRWRDRDDIQRWRTFTSQAAAESFAETTDEAVIAPKPAPRVTLEDFSTTWTSR